LTDDLHLAIKQRAPDRVKPVICNF